MKLEPKEPNLLFGIMVSLIAYLCFAVAASIVRSVDNIFPTMQIVFFQSSISLVLILPLFIKKRNYKIEKKFVSLHLIRDIVGVASFYCYFLAIKKTN